MAVGLPPDAAVLVGRFLGARQALEVGSRLCKLAPGMLATVEEVVVDWGRALEAAWSKDNEGRGALADASLPALGRVQQDFWRLLGELRRARPFIRRLLLCGVDLESFQHWERRFWNAATDLHGVVGLSVWYRGGLVLADSLSLCCDERVVILDIAECRNVGSISAVAMCTALERM
jgi:hypothetical protein